MGNFKGAKLRDVADVLLGAAQALIEANSGLSVESVEEVKTLTDQACKLYDLALRIAAFQERIDLRTITNLINSGKA